MRTAKGALLGLLLLGALTGCDEERPADTAAAPSRREEQPQRPRRKAKKTPAQGSDALAGASAGSESDDGRVLFDGDEERTGDPSAAGGVYAGSGKTRASKEDLYTDEGGRYASLKTKEPPAPYAQGGQGGGKGAQGKDQGKGQGGNKGAGGGGNDAAGHAGHGGSDPAAAKAGKQRFLFVGDSQSVGGFGQGLDEGLRQAYPGALVETFALGGSHPMWFMPGNKVSGYKSPHTFFHFYEDNDPAKLKRELKSCSKKDRKECPDMRATPMLQSVLRDDTTVVVIALGSNLLTWSLDGIWAGESVTDMAKIVKDAGKRCVWVSPAHMLGPKSHQLTPEKATEVLQAADAKIKERLKGMCDYIDDRLPYEGGDRVHLSAKRGREVSALVLERIKALVPPASPAS